MNEKISTRIIKFILLLNCLFFANFIFASESMVDLKSVNQYSKILDETRKVRVILPKGYHSTQQHYPVLYVLDGDKHLVTVAGIVESLSYGSEPFVPPLIIVSVHSENRMRDFTFSNTTSLPNGDRAPKSYEDTGKAKLFLQYLEHELKPLIDKNYRVSNPNILIGHSLGGLFSLEVLSSDSNAFSGFIAIDSSIWFDFPNTHKRLERSYDKNYKKPKALFLAIANTPYTPGFGRSSFHVDQLKKFANNIKSVNQNLFYLKSQWFKTHNHHSVYAPAVHDGLLWLFDGYQIKFSDLNFQSKEIIDSFSKLNSKLDAELKPDQSLLLWAIKKSKKWPQMQLPVKEILKLLHHFYPEN